MASNAIPEGINDLLRLSNESFAGATAIGGTVPLLINTSGSIGSDRGNLFQLETQFQDSRAARLAGSKALLTARANGRAFAFTARTELEDTYGPRYNNRWLGVGFIHNSLAIPTDDTDLSALLEKMGHHLGQHPELENTSPKVNVTAARANGFAAALTTALSNLNSRDKDVSDNKKARDSAKRALRRRLSGLVQELGQRLAEDDARWRRFGLNLPSAPSVPAVPKNVVVNTNAPEELLITCAPARNATHYRLFTQRTGVDAEPMHVGNSDMPMFHLAGLPAGQAIVVFVSAANSGAESRLSEPVSAVVRARAAA